MTTPSDAEQAVESDHSDADSADADVVRRDAGVRIRTNIQAGSTSERVNVTAEMHGEDMPDLIDSLPAYRSALAEQVEWARDTAREANE